MIRSGPGGVGTCWLRLHVLAKDSAVDAVDVHNAWAVWMQDEIQTTTPSSPFEELDTETEAADEPFVEWPDPLRSGLA